MSVFLQYVRRRVLIAILGPLIPTCTRVFFRVSVSVSVSVRDRPDVASRKRGRHEAPSTTQDTPGRYKCVSTPCVPSGSNVHTLYDEDFY